MDLQPFLECLSRLILVTFFTASFIAMATTSTHIAMTTAGQSKNKTEPCSLPVQEQNQRLVRCVRLGDKLIKKYIRHLKAGHVSRPFRLCQKFAAVDECLAPAFNCPQARDRLDTEWIHVYNSLSCACSKDGTACKENHKCFAENYRSPEADYCEALKKDYEHWSKEEICLKYKAYKNCVRTVKDQCKAGYKFILSYDGDLRTYLDKMEYICRNTLKEYVSNLPCYQNVVKKNTLNDECTDELQTLKPLMEGVTSYQYYCNLKHPRSIALKRGLDNLRRCYHKIMTSSCGKEAGDVFNKLSERAFKDPLYLKFAYKPSCHKKLFSEPVKLGVVPFHNREGSVIASTPAPPVRQNETIWVKAVQSTDENPIETYQVGALSPSNGQNVISLDKMVFVTILLCLSMILR